MIGLSAVVRWHFESHWNSTLRPLRQFMASLQPELKFGYLLLLIFPWKFWLQFLRWHDLKGNNLICSNHQSCANILFAELKARARKTCRDKICWCSSDVEISLSHWTKKTSLNHRIILVKNFRTPKNEKRSFLEKYRLRLKTFSV